VRSPAPADQGELRPDFFIVGAFKAGTTALYEYLRPHPQIFMPFHKEPHFFGDDLTRHYGRMSRAEYIALFRGAEPGQRVGEASTWYLYSTSAAREIERFTPGAQIIIQLRNPVDVMYAQHSQLLFRSDETLTDFADALAAEPARRRGEGMRPPPVRPETLFYRHSVDFADQVERYLAVFGRDRVHVILFDDLVRNTAETYRGTLEFLGIDTAFRPDFAIHNENKRVRFGVLQRLVFNPPGPMSGVARRLRRLPLAHRARDMVLRLNSQPGARPPLDPALRERLQHEFRPEIERLSRVIGRDLSAWYA
jgi:Sulfotransferase domain